MRRRLQRWCIFNLVGIAGAVVQLTVLAFLNRMVDVPVVWATALAVQAAVVHNFCWHVRWTWKDRAANGCRDTFARFGRFQATNGFISLVGNVALTGGLAEGVGLDPVVANGLAIAMLSFVNYMSGDRIVFRRSTALTVLAALSICAPALAAQSPEALDAWNKYVATVDRRHEAARTNGFFALDLQNENRWRERARAGEIPMVSLDPPGVPDAKVHHWAGGIYVPDVTVSEVLARLLEYAGRESEFYQEVKRSRLLHRDGDRVRVYLRLYRDAGPVEATYDSEHLVEYRRLPDGSATSRSVSTRIAELDRAGTPQEREKPQGEDSGFLWKLNAYWRYRQWGDGVLIECESLSLSRGVPTIIRPIANPIVNRIARESLANTLRSLKAFLR